MAKAKPLEIKAKVLLPIARLEGPCLQRGMVATFSKKEYNAFLKAGYIEPFFETSLKEAILSVKAAGGEIVCDDDNQAIINAIASIEADKAKADGEPAADK